MNELKSVASLIEVTTSFKTTLVAAVGKVKASHHQLQLSVKHTVHMYPPLRLVQTKVLLTRL